VDGALRSKKQPADFNKGGVIQQYRVKLTPDRVPLTTLATFSLTMNFRLAAIYLQFPVQVCFFKHGVVTGFPNFSFTF